MAPADVQVDVRRQQLRQGVARRQGREARVHRHSLRPRHDEETVGNVPETWRTPPPDGPCLASPRCASHRGTRLDPKDPHVRSEPRLARFGAVLAGFALFAGTVVTVPASAQEPSSTVRSGDGWSIVDLGGVYRVTLDLDEPLPLRGDAPTLVVDGETLDLAQESPDGDQLTVLTSDPGVLDATRISAGWASEADADAPSTSRVPDAAPAPTLELETAVEDTPDPAELGDVPFVKGLYRFGHQSIDLAGIGGIRGEVEGKLYLPTTGGERPVVVLLHGRHGYCSGSPSNPDRWPCTDSQIVIPNYAGYDGTAEALASNGYAVVSISANAVNANDNQLALDFGARARGQLILDTLTMLDDANAGRDVAYFDAHTDAEVTLAQALAGHDGTEALRIDPEIVDLTPADLEGRFDLDHIGLMGHSRGGEGVTSAATLNQALAEPFAIRSILPLAPVDFGRMTVPNVPNLVILPYCDGDVSNQQGQHMNDDARYAFDDDVLRSDIWVMGANHNFFNTVWTPGLYPYSVSDDWSNNTNRRNDSVCGTSETALPTSIRLTPEDQYAVGNALMAGWFRATVGGEDEFLPMFDGSGTKVDTTEDADLRVVATQPSSTRADIATFEGPTTTARSYGNATATICASAAPRGTAQPLPPCSSLANARVPHWTTVRFGGEVPMTPLLRFRWTSATGQIRVPVPPAVRDASGHDNLTFRAAADEDVPDGDGTDIAVTVVDATGASFTVPVAELNPNALVRLPQSTQNPNTLGKIVLQQVTLPLADVAEAGLDVTDLREVRFSGGSSLTGSVAGGAYLSDLSFDTPGLGNPEVTTEVAVGTATTWVEEGSGPDEVAVPVLLSAPTDVPATVYVTVLGSNAPDAKVGLVMREVTFAPGETCAAVPVPIYGDDEPSSAPQVGFTVSVTNTRNVVMGPDAFGQLLVREDDGVTGEGLEPLPLVGTADDVCAEAAARTEVGELTTDELYPAPGGTVLVTGSGFRATEDVVLTLGEAVLATVTSAADGSVAASVTIPTDGPTGPTTLRATGVGSALSAEVTLDIGGTPPVDPPPVDPPPVDPPVEPVCDAVTPVGFPDVAPVPPHGANIGCVAAFGIALGRADGTYGPRGDVRRDQMASFLARLLRIAGVELPTTPTTGFPDVDGGPHATAIAQLADVGVVAGRSNGTFDPSGSVTRAQMASFLVRSLEVALERDLTASGSGPFTDTGAPHAANIAVAAELGIAAGRTPTTFAPNDDVRRDQMASFLARSLALLQAEGVEVTPLR
ncbi:S-layer homology domain-containing protein [Nitriliruptoraceae bacterium ZYF776]|nr:S-layer homology domain-containing protein [Profundirhabdus halotolerans]